jgi:hypothetical protein
MITNQNMIRKMGTFDVTQRTKDGFFNATALAKQWNKTNNQRKEVTDFLRLNSTKEYIQAIENDIDILNTGNPVFKIGRGKYSGGTWMHPYLFIDFAMWLNPTFKLQVIKFVYDEMIKYRNLAGDSYKELCSAVSKLVPKDFVVTAIRKVAEALNYIVFGDHKNGIRNDFGEEQKQQELWEFQRKVTSLINEGFISTFESLVDYLRTSYKNKHLPKVFN